MPHFRAIVILLCLLSFSLEPGRTQNGAGPLTGPLPGVPREITLLKSLPDYFLAGLISAQPRSFIDAQLLAADALIRSGDYEGALAHLETVTRIDPDAVAYAAKKARIYKAMDRLELAIPCLESIAERKGNPATRRELAEAYTENGEFLKAAMEYEKLLGTDPDPDWVRGQIVKLTRQKLLAAGSITQPLKGGEGQTRRPDAVLLIPKDSRCVIVEKESQTLFLYRNTPHGLKLEKTYACSTGAQQGEKAVQGDERTPEGIYVPRMILPRTQLTEIYGRMAITLDYPNAFDRLEGKSGGGIWLHATNEPIRAYLPNKTRGCVVVSNEDIEELSRLLDLNRTPLIITSRIQYRKDAEGNAELEELKSFLSEWTSCWVSKQLDRYVSLYSSRFRNGSLNAKDWRAVKGSVFSRAGKINLNLELRSVVREGRYAVLTFDQDYHSDRLFSKGTKRLFVARETGGWKIVAEEWELN